jgi:cephalosporin hydroxylase
MPQSLWPLFFSTNPYENFPLEEFPADLQGWGDHYIFERVISKLRPKLIIEVGTWKGYSALMMANIIRQFGLDTQILCVDTFLGSPEHFLDPQLNKLMKFKNGFPQLYQQFLANVIHAGCQEIIVPIAQTAEGASRVLKHFKLVADFIYIDGDHSYQAVLGDLTNYWDLLRPGGILVGDDFDEKGGWPGVVKAAREFTTKNNLSLTHGDGKFLIEKPPAAVSRWESNATV